METQAELEALRRERALLIDKLNNHPDVRKYAGKASPLSGSPYFLAWKCCSMLSGHLIIVACSHWGWA